MVVRFGNAFKNLLDPAQNWPMTKEYLGGKGFGLVQMCDSGLNVPSGIIIPTNLCLEYMKIKDAGLGHAFVKDIVAHDVMPAIEQITASLGYRPLFSVRSGARVSMPGMMDTILNVGMTDEAFQEWAGRIGRRAAWDCYRRLLGMVGEIVMQIPKEKFQKKYNHIFALKGGKGKDKLGQPAKSEADLNSLHFQKMVEEYKKIMGPSAVELMQNFTIQLENCIESVFKSWNNERAKSYRKMNNIPEDWGTAVVIQQMVFGNMNDISGSGVLLTRNPATGENKLMGEFLANAQGEDVVAGTRTPIKIEEMQKKGALWNSIHTKLILSAEESEKKYKDMQDMEFTVQDGELFFLQTRSGKRTAEASFRIAVELVNEGVISKKDSFRKISRSDLEAVGKTKIDESFNVPPLVTGIPSGGSVVCGRAVLSSKDAVSSTQTCILVTEETIPDDIEGMNASIGILTATGGATSHAAVVARAMNKSCVVGAGEIIKTILPGSLVTIDGSTGNVWVDVEVPIKKAEASKYYDTLIEWAFEDQKCVELLPFDQFPNMKSGRAYAFSMDDVSDEEMYLNYLALLVDARDKSCPLIISLYEGEDFKEPEDEVLWNIFGGLATATSGKLDHILQVKSMGKVSLLLPDRLKNKDTLKSLIGRGYSIMGEVHSIEELLESTGNITISSKLKEQIGGEKVWKKLEVILKKAGLQLDQIPKVSSGKKVLFDKLSESV